MAQSKEEKIKDALCDALLKAVNNGQNNIALVWAQTYETMFGKYPSGKPDEIIRVEDNTKS